MLNSLKFCCTFTSHEILKIQGFYPIEIYCKLLHLSFYWTFIKYSFDYPLSTVAAT